MKRLLLKLTTENTFMLNSNVYKQIDSCTMFYKRFANDIISEKKKDQPDLLFENLNNYHPSIKYIIETMPQKFLDTEIIYEKNQIKTKVHRNERKLPVHWTSNIPKR